MFPFKAQVLMASEQLSSYSELRASENHDAVGLVPTIFLSRVDNSSMLGVKVSMSSDEGMKETKNVYRDGSSWSANMPAQYW